MINKIRHFICKNQFALILILIILPPLGFSLLWTADEDEITAKDKKIITLISSVVWICIVVSIFSILITSYKQKNQDDGLLVVASNSDKTSSIEKTGGFTSDSVCDTEDLTGKEDSNKTEETVDTEESAYTQVTTTASVTEIPISNQESKELVITDCSYSVHIGDSAYITVKGSPNTEYICKVKYSSGYSSAKGLGKAISDSEGYVTWSWKIGSKTSTDFKPEITVSGDGQTVKTTISVLK